MSDTSTKFNAIGLGGQKFIKFRNKNISKFET